MDLGFIKTSFNEFWLEVRTEMATVSEMANVLLPFVLHVLCAQLITDKSGIKLSINSENALQPTFSQDFILSVKIDRHTPSH